MATNEKAKAKFEQATGAAAAAAGRATGNESLAAKGRAQQMKGDARQADRKSVV